MKKRPGDAGLFLVHRALNRFSRSYFGPHQTLHCGTIGPELSQAQPCTFCVCSDRARNYSALRCSFRLGARAMFAFDPKRTLSCTKTQGNERWRESPSYRFFSFAGVWVRRQRQVNLAALELNAILIRSSSDWLMLTRCKSHDGKISRSPVTGGITMAWPVKAL